MTNNRFKHIELLLLDVDGVLTDGRITYTDGGEEIKAFHVKDGMGLRLLMQAGIKTGVVTGRRSQALIYRCQNIGIHYVFDGIKDKGAFLGTIMDRTGVTAPNIAFVGDDLPDIPLLKKVGISFAVQDAHEQVIAVCDMVTKQKGGHGAVREICEMILKEKGVWEQIVNAFI